MDIDTKPSKKQEALIRALKSRHGRKKHGLCLCEGLRACGEVITNCPDLVKFAILAADTPPLPYDVHGAWDTFVIPSDAFQRLSSTVNAQGVLLILRIPTLDECLDIPPEDPFIIVLDRLADPGNIGTIFRTLLAAGQTECWLVKGTADPFNDKVIRSAMGAQFRLRLRQFDSLDHIREAGLKLGFEKLYTTVPSDGTSLFDEETLFDKSLIILGGEANGAGDVLDSIPISIPMPGNYESLNVAQAATIILFEHVRRNVKA